MTTSRVQLSAATSRPRHAVVSAVTDAINALGWVVDARAFSNAAMAIHFELRVANLGRAEAAFRELPVTYSAASLECLARLADRQGGDDLKSDAVPGSLHITFVHDEHDLRVTVPAVPG